MLHYGQWHAPTRVELRAHTAQRMLTRRCLTCRGSDGAPQLGRRPRASTPAREQRVLGACVAHEPRSRRASTRATACDGQIRTPRATSPPLVVCVAAAARRLSPRSPGDRRPSARETRSTQSIRKSTSTSPPPSRTPTEGDPVHEIGPEVQDHTAACRLSRHARSPRNPGSRRPRTHRTRETGSTQSIRRSESAAPPPSRTPREGGPVHEIGPEVRDHIAARHQSRRRSPS